jgi:hypothetical protein
MNRNIALGYSTAINSQLVQLELSIPSHQRSRLAVGLEIDLWGFCIKAVVVSMATDLDKSYIYEGKLYPIQVVTVKTHCGKEFEFRLSVYPFTLTNESYVKQVCPYANCSVDEFDQSLATIIYTCDVESFDWELCQAWQTRTFFALINLNTLEEVSTGLDTGFWYNGYLVPKKGYAALNTKLLKDFRLKCQAQKAQQDSTFTKVHFPEIGTYHRKRGGYTWVLIWDKEAQYLCKGEPIEGIFTPLGWGEFALKTGYQARYISQDEAELLGLS